MSVDVRPEESDGAALEARGLFKRFGARHAVHDVDLVVRPGEVHGLLGRNGAGKTTLMRMILGLSRPDAGTIRLLGGPAVPWVDPLPEGAAGFVDDPRFYPYLSGRRNLSLLARLDGAPPLTPAPDRIGEVLEVVGLTAQADARVGGYSTGMRQRLGVAAALLRSPRLLLLDEPTSSLDPAGARDLRAYVRRLAGEGVAVLLSSHDMVEVEDLCPALTIVRRGRVAFSGPAERLRVMAGDAICRLRTSDDTRARAEGEGQAGVTIIASPEGGLDVRGGQAALDAYVVALGRAGVAVRALERARSSLDALFLHLTAEPEESASPQSAPRGAAASPASPESP